MSLELFLLPLIFLFSFLLIRRDFRSAVYLLMITSLLLHKEVFSIYRWDILPARIVMVSFSVFIVFKVLVYILKKNPKDRLLEDLQFVLYDPFFAAFFLLWLVQGISIIFTKNLTSSLFLYGFFTSVFLVCTYLYFQIRGKSETVLHFIKFFIFLAFLTCLFGFFQLFLYNTTGVTVGALWSVPGHLARVGSVFWDVNHYGAFIASLLPVLGILILVEGPWKKRAVNVCVFIVLLIVLVLTNSRTAWMVSFFSFVTFVSIIFFQKFRLKGIAFLFGMFVLISIPLAYEYSIKSSPFRAKIKNYFHYRLDSFDSHMLLLQGSWQVFEEYPVLGGGYGGFFEHFSRTEISTTYFGRDPAALNTRVPAHTIWGEQLSETGLIGLSAFVMLMFVILGTLFYGSFHLTNRKEQLLTTAMGATLFGWLIAGIFYSYKSEFFWLIFVFYFVYGVSVLKNKFRIENIVAFYARSTRITFLVVLALGFFLIFSGLGSTHLIPWDEAIYAEIAKNIFTTGDYLTLHWWPGELWFEKPPLYMWLVSTLMHLIGVNELAIRLPSALFGLGTVLTVYLFGKRLYNRTVGFLAAFVMLTTFQFLYYSRVGMLDVTLTFFTTLSLYFYWHAEDELKKKFWVISGVLMGCAVMTKGVVGFLPLLVILVHQTTLIVFRKKRFERELIKNVALFFVSSAAVFLPWHLAMFQRHGDSFFKSYIGYHVLKRATEGIEDKGRPIYWYLVVLKVSMRLWFIALIAAFPITMVSLVTRVRQYIISNSPFKLESYKKDWFVVIAVLCIFGFFSISASKLVWYIIPVYPFLSLVVGVFIERLLRVVAPKSILKKMFLLYLLVTVNLLYLVANKDLIYTGDLTYKQAELIQEKDKLYGNDETLYADRIELPLLLFYSDGPFEVVDFGPLQEQIEDANYLENLVFITKESRLRKFQETNPQIEMKARRDEWVLGYMPSRQEIDLAVISNLQREVRKIQDKASEPMSSTDVYRIKEIEDEILRLTNVVTLKSAEAVAE